MTRLIDADAVLNDISDLKKSPWFHENYFDHKNIRKEAIEIVEQLCIDKAPTIDAVPVRHGRWIVGDSLPMHDIAGNLSWGNWYTCNQCEFKTYAIERHITQYNYCPNCGAKMDGEDDD